MNSTREYSTNVSKLAFTLRVVIQTLGLSSDQWETTWMNICSHSTLRTGSTHQWRQLHGQMLTPPATSSSALSQLGATRARWEPASREPAHQELNLTQQEQWA